jgi:hypothetical protein
VLGRLGFIADTGAFLHEGLPGELTDEKVALIATPIEYKSSLSALNALLFDRRAEAHFN